MNEIWILGALGRSGRAIAAELATAQAKLVLVARDSAQLAALAESLGGSPRTVVADSVEAMAALIAAGQPAVVVNTIGPFAQTALPIAMACGPGRHYLDLANELPALVALAGKHDEAVATGRCFVSGAGYGVLGTESIVLKLCADRPPAATVRVETSPFVDSPGLLGRTLAATIVDGLPEGGRRYRGGRLVRASLGGEHEQLVAPDGTKIATGAMPTGDLEAAHRASGAPSAVAASSMAPSAPLIRALMPALTPILAALFSLRVVRELAIRRLAAVNIPPTFGEARHSWSHARVGWADGTVREGWLRIGDAADFTAKVAAEVALRLSRGEGRPGAWTPGALFGPELAEQAGGTFFVDGVH